MNYQEAIRIAEEREKKLREVFDKCDDNRSGSIDMEEILPVLDDLGLARRLKSDRIEFAARVFLSYDVDGSGELSFEEFKGVYNAAVDDCAGKKPKARPRRAVRRQDGPLGPDATEEERELYAEHMARLKAEESERIRRENAELKSDLKGKEPKVAEKEFLKAHKEAMQERVRRRAEGKARIAEENKNMRARLRAVQATVDTNAYDDAVDVDGDGVADMSSAEARRMMAAESAAARQALAEEHQRNEQELAEMRENARSMLDMDISDDPAGVARAEIAALKEELAR